jgi:hypothetical protein
MNFAKILQRVPETATLTDSNGENFLACDIDADGYNHPDGAHEDYILDGDQIIEMGPDGYRRNVIYTVSNA